MQIFVTCETTNTDNPKNVFNQNVTVLCVYVQMLHLQRRGPASVLILFQFFLFAFVCLFSQIFI